MAWFQSYFFLLVISFPKIKGLESYVYKRQYDFNLTYWFLDLSCIHLCFISWLYVFSIKIVMQIKYISSIFSDFRRTTENSCSMWFVFSSNKIQALDIFKDNFSLSEKVRFIYLKVIVPTFDETVRYLCSEIYPALQNSSNLKGSVLIS